MAHISGQQELRGQMVSKAEFVRDLQNEVKALSPFDISQRVRLRASCLASYQGDPDLDATLIRGYMVKFRDKPDRTPENPELYSCVISTQQSKAWQDIVWTKEILQILDHPSHRTDTSEKLRHMLENRAPRGATASGTPHNVRADKDGFVLALGSAIPRAYREILRQQDFLKRLSLQELEGILGVPDTLIAGVLDPAFEQEFEDALARCEDEAEAACA